MQDGTVRPGCGNANHFLPEATSLPIAAPYTAQQLCAVALSDKKRAGSKITFVLPDAIGKCELKKMNVADLPELIRMAVEE